MCYRFFPLRRWFSPVRLGGQTQLASAPGLMSSGSEFLSAASHCQKVVVKVVGSNVCSFEFFDCVHDMVRIVVGEAWF
jgi:hypothetical protein